MTPIGGSVCSEGGKRQSNCVKTLMGKAEMNILTPPLLSPVLSFLSADVTPLLPGFRFMYAV